MYFYLKVSAYFMPFCTSSAARVAPEAPNERHLSPGCHPSFRAGKLISVKTRAALPSFIRQGVCIHPLRSTKWLIFKKYLYIHIYVFLFLYMIKLMAKVFSLRWHVDAALMSFGLLSVLRLLQLNFLFVSCMGGNRISMAGFNLLVGKLKFGPIKR